MYGDDLLIGEKIRLTAITRDDLPAFLRWMNSMEIRRLLGQEQAIPFNMEDQTGWYEQSNKKPAQRPMAIRTLEDNTLIGNCGVMQVNHAARHCMVGIVIGEREYWGRGYGSDALNVLLRYIFMEMNLNRVGLEVYSYNTRAIKAYAKVGFVQEGVLREMVLRDGDYYDMHIMGILHREWLAKNADR